MYSMNSLTVIFSIEYYIIRRGLIPAYFICSSVFYHFLYLSSFTTSPIPTIPRRRRRLIKFFMFNACS